MYGLSQEVTESKKDYRGFTPDGDYYYKDKIFKIKEVTNERINSWNDSLNLLVENKIDIEQGMALEKQITDEILNESLEGYTQDFAKSIHPKVKSAIAAEVFIFLGIRIPKEEVDLLNSRLTQAKSIQKLENQ